MNHNGMNLVQMAHKLMLRADAKRDFVADTRELGFHVDGPSTYLSVDRQAFEVTEHTHGQLANRLGIPKRYYDLMRDEVASLLERNVQYWFQEKPERRMVRTLDGHARAFLSDRYHRIDNEQIAEMGTTTGIAVHNRSPQPHDRALRKCRTC